MVLLGDSGRDALAVVAAMRAAGTVPTAALHQEAAGPEDGVRPLQLLTHRHREVPRGAAVEPHLLPEQVQVGST